MAGAASTKPIRDGATTAFTAREWDEQNPSPGDGPFSAMPVFGDGEGGRLSKAEDSAHVSGDHGIMALAVRKDAATAVAADGNYLPLIVDATGKLWVNAVLTAGSGASDLGKAEDAAHASGDVGIMSLAVRKDTASAVAADGDYIPLIVDSTGRLWTHIGAIEAGSNLIGKVDHSSTGIGHGVTTVTTAGTDVVLAGSTPAKWVTVQSQTDNTGWIAVGASGVDATEATGTGVLLDAGESVTLPIDNLADIFIDATVNGEGVRYTYGT